MFENLFERRPKLGLRGIQLHRGNASAHTADKTIAILGATHVKLMTHPAYNADLAPCDFSLSATAKNRMRGEALSSLEEAVIVYEVAVKSIEKETWQDWFRRWFPRTRRCIDSNNNNK